MTARTAVTEFPMPSLGADMDAGTVLEWLVAPGDEVHRGQVVAVVDTAKAAIEIEVFHDGVVREILVKPGTRVAVGTPLATLEVPLAAAESVAPATPTRSIRVATPPVRHLAHQLGVDVESVPGTGPGGAVTRQDVLAAAESGVGAELGGGAEAAQGGVATSPATPAAAPRAVTAPRTPSRPRATPRARRIAESLHVDLADVVGTGRAGAVTADDVRAAAEAAQAAHAVEATEAAEAAKAAEKTEKAEVAEAGEAAAAAAAPAPRPRRAARASQEAMRAAIAALMARSNREIPHYYVRRTIDLAPALSWLRSRNEGRPVKERVLPAAMMARAVVLALDSTPELNGFWGDDRFQPAEHVDLGVAVALRGGGMVAPALVAAEEMDLDVLMARLGDLVRRARVGRLRQSEMAGGSITVSNLGESGADELAGVIYPPQVALVGIGGIVDRPWAVQGMLAVRRTVTVTLAADHRASDGRTGSAFLAALAEVLTKPEEL